MVKRHAAVQETSALKKAGFIVSDATLASMARDFVEGVRRADAVRGTYLPVLVAHSKRELGSRRLVTPDQALAAITKVHDHMYAVIKEAVFTPDVAAEEGLPDDERRRRALERNRRTTFARTALATLTKAVESGAKLQSLDPASVTKESLRQYYAKPREGPVSIEDRIQRTETRLEELLREVASEDPATAQQLLADVQAKLEQVLEPAPAAPVRQMRGRRQVGEITLHPH